MDKFTNVLNKLGLRGSSEDDGHRSAQSTPRLSRSQRVRDPEIQHGQRTYGSMGSVENYRVRLNQDWTRELGLNPSSRHPRKKKKPTGGDTDRVPRLGLDRAWQTERARGMELVHQSVERQRERQRQKELESRHHHSKSHSKKKRKERHRSQSHDRLEHYLIDPVYRGQPALIDPNFRLSQERLERRIDELNKQLLAEKHSCRQDKLTLARLQQEMSRQKSERQLRETLMRELERERMLRMDAEHRLCEVTSEHEASKSRLLSLQEEFQKMEEMVRSMLQYKGKLEALKSEKASLSINYEHSMQKLRTHVGNLEHENKILMAEIKKLESQCANCHLCNKDLVCHVTKQSHSTQADGDGDKAKVLLERLKMLEAEKSALVLENEAQRQQYDKCLDQIANQVVQALMSQKTLREECNKLQKRVQDLEAQNKQLSHMFMHRIKFASDSVLQSLACKKLAATTTPTSATLNMSNSGSASLCAQTQVTFVNGGSPRPAQIVSESSRGIGTFSEVSLESLQSICSDYNEQPQLSSPPAWLRDQVFMTGESPTSSITSPQGSEVTEHAQKKQVALSTPGLSSSSSSLGSDVVYDVARHSINNMTRMPPIGHTSSPSHVTNANGHMIASCVLEPNVLVHNAPKVFKASLRPVGNKEMLGSSNVPCTKIETEFPVDMTSPKIMHYSSHVKGQSDHRPVASASANTGPSLSSKQDDILRALNALTGKSQSFPQNNCSSTETTPSGKSDELLPAPEHLSLGDGLTNIQNNLYDDSDSDDSYSASLAPSKHLSAASTISLNELLEQGLDDMETPNDDSFSIEDFHCVDTDEERLDCAGGGNAFGALIKAGQAVLATNDNLVSPEGDVSKKSSSSQTSPSLEHSLCDLEDRKEMVLNNHSSVVLCKPPLPRPLPRPNSLDLPVPASRGHQKSESKSCVEYSSSESSSDGDEVKVKLAHDQKDLKNQKEQPAKLCASSMVRDIGHVLAISRPIKDHGDYVMLKAPGKLAKLTNQDSGVSEPQDGIQNVNSTTCLAPTDGTDQRVSAEGSPETSKANQGTARHQVTSSPDSAMQQSFSSSSSGSDTVLGDRPSFRDDGYSSNSAVSFGDGHVSKGNQSECVSDPSHKASAGLRPPSGVNELKDSQSKPKGKQQTAIGKVDGFNPVNNSEYEKSAVWTREGICEEMKATYQRRSSLGNICNNALSDTKTKGLVSEMKTRFERKFGDRHQDGADRRHSLPTNRQDEGDYVCLDPCYQSLAQVPVISNNNNIHKEALGVLPTSNKPSRPKMGIHAKTRSLIAGQRSRSLPRSIMSTYPSDSCLCKKSPPTSQKVCEPPVQHVTRLKRTNSDSCLADHTNNVSFVTEVGNHHQSSLLPKPQPSDKIKETLKEKPRSSISLSKLNKSSTKDKNQCVVGYVISEPPVPEYQLDIKMPRVDPGYYRSHSDPQKICLLGDLEQMFLRSHSDPEKGIRVTGEGSECGYKSAEDPIYSSTRPEVVGADQKSHSIEITTGDISNLAFDVRKYKQQPPAVQVQSHVSLNLSLWSSDSDGDSSKTSEIQLTPMTVSSPSSHDASPSHMMSPPACIQSSEVSTDYSKRRPLVMSYPPRSSDPEKKFSGSYHTLPADGMNSKSGTDFKQIMECLAKKSEDVLKSKIFHSDNSQPKYDVILNIGLDDQVRDQHITNITEEIDNLTKTVDDLQRSMSSIELEEDEGIKGISVIPAMPSTSTTHEMNQCTINSYGKIVQKYSTHTNIQKQSSQYYSQLMEASSSSCDDEFDESSLGDSMLGDAFVRKFRRRKKKKHRRTPHSSNHQMPSSEALLSNIYQQESDLRPVTSSQHTDSSDHHDEDQHDVMNNHNDSISRQEAVTSEENSAVVLHDGKGDSNQHGECSDFSAGGNDKDYNRKECKISTADYTGLKPLQHKAVLSLKIESRRDTWENR